MFILVDICYRYADGIFKKLGYNATNVVSRLAAFILLAISVAVIWDGILGLIMPLIHN